MAFSLFTVARDFLVDEAKFRERHPHAWLVWTLGKPTAEPIIAPTLTHGGGKKVPEVGDPIAIPILKGKAGAFALGVTIGRTENNDVVLRHSEVSRFHAY